MSKPQVLVTGNASDRMLERLGHTFEVHQQPRLTDEFASEHGENIDYMLSLYHGGVDGPAMDKLPNLKAISNYGVGYDAVDTTAAVERGIVVTHTPNVLNDDVANLAILLMLAVSRNLNHDEAYLRAGKWESQGNAPLTRSVRGRQVGIGGLGRIGMAIAEKLGVFGVDVVYHTRTKKDVAYRYYDDLLQMATDSDYLIAITPGGAATYHLINEPILNALGPDGTLINVARGSVVDEQALIKALQDGRLGWAGLDVFDAEPHVPAELIAMNNVTLLPHVASATVDTRNAMADLAVDNLVQHHTNGKAIAPVPECQDM